MAQVCELTGVRPLVGNKVSNSNRKTKRRALPNLKKKTYFVPELKRPVTLRLSTRAMRTIDRHGSLTQAILKASTESLSDKALKIRRELTRTH